MPRSTSTAFERMMRERGDFGVHDEPFGQSFTTLKSAVITLVIQT
ncbi:MAG: hypothetical protein O4859_08485 [Trichodesmium sp. St18_bin1]|nr:hypothetical protein [Trichodesmium sp. St18_bin1]